MSRPRRFLVMLATLSGCAQVDQTKTPGPSSEPEFTLEFKHPTGNPPTVVISVGKVDPVAGMVAWEGPHAVGDRIGWGMENGVPTSRHRVRSVNLNRDVDVDFDTDTVLVDIRATVKISYEIAYCERIPKQPPVVVTPCDGIRIRSLEYQADEFEYLDRKGVRRVVRNPALPPHGDRLCTLHGGDRPVRKVTPPEERQELIDSAAFSLLGMADSHWKSKNPAVRRKAPPIYRDLLEKYACAKVVIENRNRLLERSQASIEE